MWLIATRLTAGVDSSPRHTLPRDKRHPNRATYDTLAGATVKTTGRRYLLHEVRVPAVNPAFVADLGVVAKIREQFGNGEFG